MMSGHGRPAALLLLLYRRIIMLTLSYLQRSAGRRGEVGGRLEAERILGGNYETTRAPSAVEEGRGLMAAMLGG